MPKTPAAICHRCLVSTANDIKWADVWNTTCHMLNLQFTPSPFQWQFSRQTWVSQLFRGCFPLHLLEKTMLVDKRHRIFTGQMPILSPNQWRQSTEGNSKALNQSVKKSHWAPLLDLCSPDSITDAAPFMQSLQCQYPNFQFTIIAVSRWQFV